MRRLSSTTLSFDDVKGATTKDLELGTFNVVDKCVPRKALFWWLLTQPDRLLCPDRPATINERLNFVFQDADIIPLFIQARTTCCS